MEAAGSKDPDDEPPEAVSLVDKGSETLAGDSKPPEVNSLVGEEMITLLEMASLLKLAGS